MDIVPHMVPRTHNRIAFTTVPPLTATAYRRLRPMLQHRGFPRHTFRVKHGKVFFDNAAHFMHRENLSSLAQCMQHAHERGPGQ